MPKIIDGVVRFKSEVHPQKKALFDELAKGQSPEALFITCSDSRIEPSLLVQSEPGDLFVCRNAGNIVPPYTNNTSGMVASIEYAVAALNVQHIVVCGHSSCGAMQGVMNPEAVAPLPQVAQWLTYSKAAYKIVQEKMPNASAEEQLVKLIEENVLLQLQHLKTHPQVAAKLAAGEIQLHGWTYDIGSGDIKAYDEISGEFVLVDEIYAEEAKAFVESQHKDCQH